MAKNPVIVYKKFCNYKIPWHFVIMGTLQLNYAIKYVTKLYNKICLHSPIEAKQMLQNYITKFVSTHP